MKVDLSKVKIIYDGWFPPAFIVEKGRDGDMILMDGHRDISKEEAMEIINKLSLYLLKKSNTKQVLLASDKIEIRINEKETKQNERLD